MGLTNDEYVNVSTGQTEAARKGPVEVEINPANPFPQRDYSLIVQTFEMEASNWEREDYAKAHQYRDVYSTRNFSERTREQMAYYPGMHQSAGAPSTDPLYTRSEKMARDRLGYWNNAMCSTDNFAGSLAAKQKDFDYATIFGSSASGEERAKEIGKLLSECIPCLERFTDLLPDGDLLEIHAMNIKIRTDLLDKIATLFKDPGQFIDICDLLKLLSHLCPQDLLAIIALLSQYLAKLNLDFRFNLNFIIQLVGPILSPFLDALSQWLDKWIQLILGPMICVLDHINETILIAQSAEIPLSNVSGNIEMDLGIAGPAHNNAAGSFQTENNIGFGEPRGVFQEDVVDPHASTWGSWQWEEFNTPDSEKYNPTVPVPPEEEIELSRQEMEESWSPSFSDDERRERTARFQELQERNKQQRREVPPPLKQENRDGSRWSKDDIPNSEKYVAGDEWQAGGYYPPEKQDKPREATQYYVTTPLVNSIVQLRNIMQGAIQYVKDWFTYITQMIYDLLGTDIGWMDKKIDNTILKSRIIQMILMVKSMLEAIAKNGLECGTNTNYNEAQMRFILEEGLNQFSAYKFEVQEDGSIVMLQPGYDTLPSAEDLSSNIETQQQEKAIKEGKTKLIGTTPDQEISEPESSTDKQSYSPSGTIIKDCFKNVSQDELQEVRKWIIDFEKRQS